MCQINARREGEPDNLQSIKTHFAAENTMNPVTWGVYSFLTLAVDILKLALVKQQ